jgi:hypothetical protein
LQANRACPPDSAKSRCPINRTFRARFSLAPVSGHRDHCERILPNVSAIFYAEASRQMFAGEALGLQAMYATGALRIPRVYACNDDGRGGCVRPLRRSIRRCGKSWAVHAYVQVLPLGACIRARMRFGWSGVLACLNAETLCEYTPQTRTRLGKIQSTVLLLQAHSAAHIHSHTTTTPAHPHAQTCVHTCTHTHIPQARANTHVRTHTLGKAARAL